MFHTDETVVIKNKLLHIKDKYIIVKSETVTYFRQPDNGFWRSSSDLHATPMAARGQASRRQITTRINRRGAIVTDIITT